MVLFEPSAMEIPFHLESVSKAVWKWTLQCSMHMVWHSSTIDVAMKVDTSLNQSNNDRFHSQDLHWHSTTQNWKTMNNWTFGEIPAQNVLPTLSWIHGWRHQGSCGSSHAPEVEVTMDDGLMDSVFLRCIMQCDIIVISLCRLYSICTYSTYTSGKAFEDHLT